MKSGRFRLPGKPQLQQPDVTWDAVSVDVTEVPIERPQKNSEPFTVAFPKRHTLKAQLVIDSSVGSFLQLQRAKGECTT